MEISQVSSNINQGIKAVLFFKQKKDESKSFGIGKLVRVSPYIPTFTNLLNSSEYSDLSIPQIKTKR